jgi:hypothetical protein
MSKVVENPLQITAIGAASRDPAKGYTTTKWLNQRFQWGRKKHENGPEGFPANLWPTWLCPGMVFEEEFRFWKKNRFFVTFFDQFNA